MAETYGDATCSHESSIAARHTACPPLRARVRFVGLVITLSVLPLTVAAKEPFDHDKFERVVDSCVQTVRRERADSVGFDAYVEGTKLRYLGTREERFKFEK